MANNRRNGARWSLGVRSHKTFEIDDQIEIIEQDHRLKITPLSGITGNHYNGYSTESAWDLTGGNTSVEVVQTTSDAATTIFALVVDSNNWYRFSVESATLYFENKVGGVLSSAKTSYNPAEHKFWRFRHDQANGLMLWETSPNSIQWKVRHAVTPQVPITALYVELNAGTNQVVTSPGSAVFDNFQIVLKQ